MSPGWAVIAVLLGQSASELFRSQTNQLSARHYHESRAADQLTQTQDACVPTDKRGFKCRPAAAAVAVDTLPRRVLLFGGSVSKGLRLCLVCALIFR